MENIAALTAAFRLRNKMRDNSNIHQGIFLKIPKQWRDFGFPSDKQKKTNTKTLKE